MGKFETAKMLSLSVGVFALTVFFSGAGNGPQALAAPLDEAQRAGRDEASLR